jgi:hypothetical protein
MNDSNIATLATNSRRRVPLSGENDVSRVRVRETGILWRGDIKAAASRQSNARASSFARYFESGSSDFNRPSDAITRASSAWRLVPVLE